ncbi:MAG: hypothetical protein ACYCUD_14585 [Candidatus Dormibacteria bacterium]
MAADESAEMVERSPYVDATRFTSGIGVLLTAAGVGTAVATAVWLRPRAIYWVVLLGFLAVMAAVTLRSEQKRSTRILEQASSTSATLTPRRVGMPLLWTSLFVSATLAALSFAVATIDPAVLGTLSGTALTGGAMMLLQVRWIRAWETRTGFRLLVRPRLGRNRSDFLIQIRSSPR